MGFMLETTTTGWSFGPMIARNPIVEPGAVHATVRFPVFGSYLFKKKSFLFLECLISSSSFDKFMSDVEIRDKIEERDGEFVIVVAKSQTALVRGFKAQTKRFIMK